MNKKKTFAQELLQGAREAALISRGDAKPGRITRRSLSESSTISEPPPYDAKRIRTVRERLNVSQSVFARILNASDATVKAWEQGKRAPEGTALRLLELAEKEPGVVTDMVGVGVRKQRQRSK